MSSSTYEERRQILEQDFLLGKLSRGEIDTLLAYSRVDRYPAGEEIYAKGSPGQSRSWHRVASLSEPARSFSRRVCENQFCFFSRGAPGSARAWPNSTSAARAGP